MTTITTIIFTISLLTPHGVVDKVNAEIPKEPKQCVIDAKEPVVNGRGVFTMKEYCMEDAKMIKVGFKQGELVFCITTNDDNDTLKSFECHVEDFMGNPYQTGSLEDVLTNEDTRCIERTVTELVKMIVNG